MPGAQIKAVHVAGKSVTVNNLSVRHRVVRPGGQQI